MRARLVLLLLLVLAAGGCGGGDDDATPGRKEQGKDRPREEAASPSREQEDHGRERPERTQIHPRPGASKPCSLLTRSDIGEALHREVKDDGHPKNAGISHVCDWKVAHALNFRVAVFDTVQSYLPKIVRRGFKPVSGLGEAAEFRANQPVPYLSEIWVRLSDAAFVVQFTVPVTKRAPSQQDPFVSLAEKVIDRLGERD